MGCAVTPTKAGIVASGYGPRPGRRTGEIRFHAGLDFRAPAGTPVVAPADGVVETMATDDGGLSTSVSRGVSAAAFRGYGNVLVLRLSGPVWMSFNHLRSFAPGLAPGVVVRRGQLLGYAGNTSNGKFRGMGAHLHLETRHAPVDGRLTPFPGPYGRDNFDPVDWFERHGVFLEGRRLVQVGTCAPATTATSKGLGQALPVDTDVSWKSIGDSKPRAPAGTEYEPPRKMAPSIGMVVLTLGAGIGLIGLGIAVWRESLPIPFLKRVGLGDVGALPTQLMNEIHRESTDVKSLIEWPPDCDEAYLRLANGYRLLLRANKMSTSSKEDARIDRIAKNYDELAKQVDQWCSE